MSSYVACADALESTVGQNLYSGSLMTDQVSCKPSIGNFGKYYSPSTALAGGVVDNHKDSICPKGWSMPNVNHTDYKGYKYLYQTAYKLKNSTDMNNLPLSFNMPGHYEQGVTSIRSHGTFLTSNLYYAGYLGRYNDVYLLSIVEGKNPDVTFMVGGSWWADMGLGYSLRCGGEVFKK